MAPTNLAWAPGPSRPRLDRGALHVWRADLAPPGNELQSLLSADEQERGERFRHSRDGQLWMCSRGVLRALLGRYLGVDPTGLRFTAGAHGKPALLGSQTCFNLSHSGDLALYAFSDAGAVGVDVELPRRSIKEVALATRAFGQADAQHLSALDPADREREFLRLWTRREAELKCAGSGIGGADSARPGAAWTTELDVGPRSAGAVATRQPPASLHCWDWT
jgi:4'-phosphopantetheinyl transferase